MFAVAPPLGLAVADIAGGALFGIFLYCSAGFLIPWVAHSIKSHAKVGQGFQGASQHQAVGCALVLLAMHSMGCGYCTGGRSAPV